MIRFLLVVSIVCVLGTVVLGFFNRAKLAQRSEDLSEARSVGAQADTTIERSAAKAQTNRGSPCHPGAPDSARARCAHGGVEYHQSEAEPIIYAGILPDAKAHGLYNNAVGNVDRNYFYADPRSFIGTNPDVGDSLITEYPAYSLILGDLHAQIIDIIFVLTFLALLLSLLFGFKNRRTKSLPVDKTKYYTQGKKYKTKQKTSLWHNVSSKISTWFAYFNKLLPVEYYPIILFLPIMFMTNTWDFPIYVVVTASILGCAYLKSNNFKSESLLFTLVDIIKIVAVSLILLIPFLVNFFDPTDGLRLTQFSHILSGVYLFKLFVVWGMQIFFCHTFHCLSCSYRT